ncbi:MAG: glycoside hydrolase family 18 protein, partial [Bacteroidetes bacterium]|nr:glycoside hydrolase family 18 protein [Bacteroidota bacterium]
MKLPVLIFPLILLMLSCGLSSENTRRATHPENLKIVAYVGRSAIDDMQIQAQKITHINFAFANIIDGRVVEGRPGDSTYFDRLIALKRQNPNLKILCSVGGWSWSKEFSDAALTFESRERLARSAVNFMIRHDLDGLDLDWEYPGLPGDKNPHRPEDKENFTALLKSIREKLDKLSVQNQKEKNDYYLLTIATGAFQAYLDHTDMRTAHQYLDFINIMSYDFYTSGAKTTGHHTNLSPSYHNLTDYSMYAIKAVEQHINAGIPHQKLVLGTAFYGRGWEGVTPINNGLYQEYSGSGLSYSYARLSAEYINKNGFVRYWDDGAEAPYLWNDSTRTFITYDNPESLSLKADYVIEKGLGGVMFWEYSHDPSGVLLN